jgi:DNA modification methylase
MKQPEYQGKWHALHNSDCIEGMHAMPAQSVDCMVTSIPFGDLFVYSDSERDLGNAGTGEKFLEQYKYFAEALTRVMKPGRVACIHVTDLPTRKGKHGFIGLQDFSGDIIRAHQDAGMIYHSRVTIWKDPVVEMQRTKALGLLYKQIRKDSTMNRIGMPDYMLMFRAHGDNPDRVEHCAPNMETEVHEVTGHHCEDCGADHDFSVKFCHDCGHQIVTYKRTERRGRASKEAVDIAKKWLKEMHRLGLASETPSDDALAELIKHAEFDVYEWQKLASPIWMDINQGKVLNGWRGAKAENDERHVCPLQLDTIERCLRLYSKPGDVVMDPFNGIGSTGYQAIKMFRRYLGFELKPEYAALSGRNLAEAEASAGGLFDAA